MVYDPRNAGLIEWREKGIASWCIEEPVSLADLTAAASDDNDMKVKVLRLVLMYAKPDDIDNNQRDLYIHTYVFDFNEVKNFSVEAERKLASCLVVATCQGEEYSEEFNLVLTWRSSSSECTGYLFPLRR